ncbi:TetR/AcrR family transcriptional regulator [Dethiobacter alkaliphilus]|uniref:Transcriptional regulator, TetR family n=1 Tax=Dethiobacter alkaliphilus AHT 1 TaxID=555088 RepID=C0GCJ9_DETAL|nr:TetR/AcrR family transcriptional regulator [Dethiobacter alkaliphilus]EEG78934.1 transcriptional regulator, TetR family [Dethiobacter alkaliphilus AHT 1]
MDGYEKRTQQKKEAILAAARELFFANGPSATSIAEIADMANVSQVTIYNYFGSKDRLVHLVMEQYMQEKLAEMEELVARDIPFPEKIEKLLFAKKESAKEIEDRGFLQFISMEDPELREMLDEFTQSKTLPAVLRLIKQGQEQGYVNPGISAKGVLLFIEGARATMERPGFFDEDNEKLRREIAELVFYGLLGKGNH